MTHNLATQLNNRSVIRLSGADRRAFLQGLISNDIELCTPANAIYAALLTPQGKFLHEFFVVDTEDSFLIDCEAARAEDLLKRLGMYKLRAKVTLENAAQEFDVWAMWNLDSYVHRHDVMLYADPRLPELGVRMIIQKGGKPGTYNSVDFAAYDKHRLALGVPDGSCDMIVEKSTLLESNFDRLNGISWSKGCYMGQELTARMHYRALVKKRLFPVKIFGAAPAFGSAVTLNDEDIGDMRSSCGDVGLALLNIEKAEMATKQYVALVCADSTLSLIRRPARISVVGN